MPFYLLGRGFGGELLLAGRACDRVVVQPLKPGTPANRGNPNRQDKARKQGTGTKTSQIEVRPLVFSAHTG